MTYNCPKCHCGCLFEDHGKLVCMNCGAETTKAASARTPHVHHYKTYASPSGNRKEKPKTVRTRTATPNISVTPSGDAVRKKKQGPLSKIAAVITILALLSPLTELVEDIFDGAAFSTETPAPEPETIAPDSAVPGTLYWEAYRELTEEEIDFLNELTSEYNEKYESPNVETVVAFIDTYTIEHDMPFWEWTITQDGGDVRLTIDK